MGREYDGFIRLFKRRAINAVETERDVVRLVGRGERRRDKKTLGVHPIMAPISVDLTGFSVFSTLLSSASLSLSVTSRWCSESVGSVSGESPIICGLKENAPCGTNVDAMTIAESTVNCGQI